jgi:ATP-dependent Clp protease adaptor protein ClpS
MAPNLGDAVETSPETSSQTKLAPLYRVLIHNDDVTPMDFVVHVLQTIFSLALDRAMGVMWEAHHTGVAHVVTEPLENAEFHVDRARSLSRGRGWPLSFSIEPED